MNHHDKEQRRDQIEMAIGWVIFFTALTAFSIYLGRGGKVDIGPIESTGRPAPIASKAAIVFGALGCLSCFWLAGLIHGGTDDNEI